MKGFAVDGATTTHGGIIRAAQNNQTQMGSPFLRAGDGHYCPQCKCWSTIQKSHNHIIFDDQPVAYEDDLLSCGARIMRQQTHTVGDTQGSFTISFGELPNEPSSQAQSFMAGTTTDSTANNFEVELVKAKIKDNHFVPCGVPAFDGKASSEQMIFEVKAKKGIFEYFIIEVEQTVGKFVQIARVSGNSHVGETLQVAWDGFIDDIYDSKLMTQPHGLPVRIRAFAYDQEQCMTSKNLKFKYGQKDWMDVRIDRHQHKIDIILRVELKDGGATGLTDGHKVPAIYIKNNKRQPIQKQEMSFEELKTMALEGMNYYWSRNAQHLTGKHILIKQQPYQVSVNTIATANSAMPPMPLVYVTNAKPGRGRNWEFSRQTFYNHGYMYFSSISEWRFWNKYVANDDFMHTFAHEMGHELLLAYGGHMYSKTHKDSSTLLTQEPFSGSKYPHLGEIDLMKYAEENENDIPNFFQRSVAAQKDVVGLLFISGLAVK